MPSSGPLTAKALLLVAAIVVPSMLLDPSSREMAGAFAILACVAAPLLWLLWELVRPTPKGHEEEVSADDGEDKVAADDGEEKTSPHAEPPHAKKKKKKKKKTIKKKKTTEPEEPEEPDRVSGIKFTGRVCDFRACMQQERGRADGGGEFDDDELFATPPPPEECPLCCNSMPEGVWNWAEGVSSEISHWQPCCGKKICCGCVFAVHFPEFKNQETFTRALKPVFLKPINKAAKSNNGNKAKEGNPKKKKGKGKGKKQRGKGDKAQPAWAKGSKAQPAPKGACCVPAPCKAQPLGDNAPPPSEEEPFIAPPSLESEERTIRLNLDGSLKYEATGTCPFCRSPELKGPQVLAAVEKHIGDGCPDTSAEAWFFKGKCHYRGANGLAKSLKKSRECWEKAAELGNHMMAHYALGMFYPRDEAEWKSLGYDEDMTGCQDIERARHHLTKAAMLGHPEARYNLAYHEAKDGYLHRAFLHYRIAARQGYDKALKQCEHIYKQGLGDVVPDYHECVEAHAAVHEEMRTEERKVCMRHRWLEKNGVMKNNPVGSFCATMFGKAYTNCRIMVNGNQEFTFNPDKGQYEEVKNEEDQKMIGRLAADGRPLKVGLK